jgi:hypothetical protein
MKIHAFSLALCVTAIPAQASAQTWLCIADMTTGFGFDKTTKRWKETSYSPEESRYIVTPSNKPEWEYLVMEFGSDDTIPYATCRDGPTRYGFISCDALFGEFKFNKNNLRYVRTSVVGYAEITPTTPTKDGDDAPVIEIGRCSKIK